MSSTSSRPGVQTAHYVKECLAENQQQSQLTHRGSKPEGTDNQGMVMPSPGEDIYCPPRAWENWFMIGLLYRMLKSLIDLVLLRRLEQSEAKMPGSQPESRSGMNTYIGNRNEDSGNIQRSGKITITYKGTAPQGDSAAARGLEIAKELVAVNARAGHDNKRCARVEDSANLDITHE